MASRQSEVRIRLIVDSTGAIRAIEGVDKKLDSLSGDPVRATGSLDQLGAAAGGAAGMVGSLSGLLAGLGAIAGGASVLGTLTKLTGEVISFEREMANVATLVDLSTVNLGRMQGQLLGLSGVYGSAQDRARGLYQALSAGVDAAQAVDLVAESSKFATAALTDTFTAVDILTTVINAYGLEASKAGYVSDVLFQAVKDGKTTGQELAASLGKVIPTAATLNVELPELAAAVATLTKGGISTAEAVTYLNATLLAFLRPAESVKTKLKGTGFEMSASTVQARGLQGALRGVMEAAEGDLGVLAQLIPSAEALKAVLALTGKQADEFTKIQANMAGAVGNTNLALDKQANTIGKQAEAFWTNLTDIWLEAVGEGHRVAGVLGDINWWLERIKSNLPLDVALDLQRMTSGVNQQWVNDQIRAMGLSWGQFEGAASQRFLLEVRERMQATGEFFRDAATHVLKGMMEKVQGATGDYARLQTAIKAASDEQNLLNSMVDAFRSNLLRTAGGQTMDQIAVAYGESARNLLQAARQFNLQIGDEHRNMLETLAGAYDRLTNKLGREIRVPIDIQIDADALMRELSQATVKLPPPPSWFQLLRGQFPSVPTPDEMRLREQAAIGAFPELELGPQARQLSSAVLPEPGAIWRMAGAPTGAEALGEAYGKWMKEMGRYAKSSDLKELDLAAALGDTDAVNAKMQALSGELQKVWGDAETASAALRHMVPEETFENLDLGLEKLTGFQDTLSGFGAMFEDSFRLIAAGVEQGGMALVAALMRVVGMVLSKLGLHLLGQGLAEIALGTAPPPFGPRPDLVAHGIALKKTGTTLAMLGAGLSIGGSALGTVAGATGRGGAPGSVFNPINTRSVDQGPLTLDLSGRLNQARSLNELAGAVGSLDKKIGSMAPGDVVSVATYSGATQYFKPVDHALLGERIHDEPIVR